MGMSVVGHGNQNEAAGNPWIRGLVSDLWILGKPRITGMVLISTAVGFVLARGLDMGWLALGQLCLATWLLGSGVNALNQYLERDTDALMTRTRDRPLPSGRMRPATVAWVGVLASTVGVMLLGVWHNPASALVGMAVVVSYVAIYTPMKRRSALNTLVGSVPGALPPLLGWVAVRGQVDPEAWALFLILFVWQPTHFMPIAYLYHEEYQRAGLAMLTVTDPGRAPWVVILYTVTLIPLSLYPVAIGLAGGVYAIGALVLGLVFLSSAVGHARHPSRGTALMHLKVSVLYLPLILGLMVYDLQGST